MSLLTIELQKEKRTGVIPVLIVVGILGAACKRPQNVPVQIFDSNNSAFDCNHFAKSCTYKNWHDRFAAGYI